MHPSSLTLCGFVCAGAAALALALSASLPAEAARAKKKFKQARPAVTTVTAVSRSNLQTVSGPVRRGRWGLEVRMPGGTWLDCKGDCRETLREETVDFWERQEQRGRDRDTRR